MRFAQAWEMYERIPMKTSTVLPDAGFDVRMVNVASKWHGHEYRLPVYCIAKPKGKKHRVFAICNCGKHVPFGRLGQHGKACPAMD